MKTLLIGAAIAGALCTPALAQDARLKQCFNSNQIRASRIVDDSTINVEVGRNLYQIKMSTPCPGLRTSNNGYTLTLRGGSQICSAIDLDIVGNGIGATRCIAGSIRQLTPAEMAALPKKEKP